MEIPQISLSLKFVDRMPREHDREREVVSVAKPLGNKPITDTRVGAEIGAFSP